MNRLFVTPLLLGLLHTALPTQEPTPHSAATGAATGSVTERLQTLLRELRATDPKAWAVRIAALEEEAKAKDAEAGALRLQVNELAMRAAAADAAAKALRVEQGQLVELQKLVASLPQAGGAQTGNQTAAPAAATTPPFADKPAPAPAKEPLKAKAPATELVTWSRVAALFADHCTSCHEPNEQKGGLDLTTYAATRIGGGSGQSIVAGEPDQSRLYRMVAQQERPFMPRNAEPLGKEQLTLVRTWIEHGAAEDAAGARTFLSERAATAKAGAVAAEAAAATEQVVPMPEVPRQLAVRIPPRPGPIASLARSPRAPLLAMAGDQQVLLFDTGMRTLAVLPSEFARIGPIAFTEDGSALLAAGGNPGARGAAALFDVRTGNLLATCGQEGDVPLAAAVHRGRGLVALGGSSKHVRIYRLVDGNEAMAGKHGDFVLSVAFSPDGKWLAAGDRAGTIQVWETDGGRVFQTLAGHQGAVHAVTFDRTGKSLLTAGADGTLRMWNVADAKERWRQSAHPNQQALAAAFGPGDAVASCGSDGVIQVYSSAGRALAKSPAVGEWLYAVAFGNDDSVVLAGDWQGRLHRFDSKGKKVTVTVPLAREQAQGQ